MALDLRMLGQLCAGQSRDRDVGSGAIPFTFFDNGR